MLSKAGRQLWAALGFAAMGVALEFLRD